MFAASAAQTSGFLNPAPVGTRDMRDPNLAQYILCTSMRKLDQGRRSRHGIQLERGLLIAVTALKARQILWERELRLRRFLEPEIAPVQTSMEVTPVVEPPRDVYRPVCSPVSPEKPRAQISPGIDSIVREFEGSPVEPSRVEDESGLGDDSLSDESSTDEDLLPADEEMNRMVYSTITEHQENVRWRFDIDRDEDADDSVLSTPNVEEKTWTMLEPAETSSSTLTQLTTATQAMMHLTPLDVHAEPTAPTPPTSPTFGQRKRRLCYGSGETNPDPFLPVPLQPVV